MSVLHLVGLGVSVYMMFLLAARVGAQHPNSFFLRTEDQAASSFGTGIVFWFIFVAITITLSGNISYHLFAGYPLEASQLTIAETYERVGNPIQEGNGYLVFLRNRQGSIRAYIFPTVPSTVFQVRETSTGELQFDALPRK